jgi:hypothetical protein
MTYKTILVESGTVYKPQIVNKNIMLPYGQYNNFWITKFLVLENSASAIKLWTLGVDPEDSNASVDIPTGALIVGNEYDLTIGKMTWSGTLKILAYQMLACPHDYPDTPTIL